ncbi:glycosyl transferase group 1 [Hyphomicrobium denitrificans ATCC 51888]|uniref:Glycosyl transferase group 1 n=1 Tax=Hyphomicrobium denitrificans (strain ATCC 51888 / DSM 1869 / NCIMB 11706 / TK 0415) TaxID=582899 RepID=D8JRI1_HYPDA|nr:glycosyltransferase family 4 protein [Hyphomicrobium denitrificans]ADJ22210.1 glycosyl transferase group 1 [Hyphomicrobium denitrificans ATCC 51888]
MGRELMGLKRPTILQIIPELATGGAELSAIEIAAAVVRAGGRAIVLSEGGRMADRLASVGGELVIFPAATKNPMKLLANATAIERIARKENVDLIHARSRAPAWSALIAARRAKLPFVTTYHGIYNEKGRAKRLYNSVMARGDIVIANSRYTADIVKKRYATPEERIRVIYRGVDLDAFDPAVVSAERVKKLRDKWGVADDQRIVLHAARLTKWKGQGDVIAAAARIRDKVRDCVFILAGDAQGRDDYRQGLLDQIASTGLEGIVRLVGHVDDIPAAFSASHIAFVASNEPEAFGRAAAEAQAMACPVISTNIGAPPETVLAPPRVAASDRTGWLVAPGDIDNYESVLLEALSLGDAARAEIGARARRHVMEMFSTFKMQRLTLAVYDELLKTSMQLTFARGN